VTLIGYQRRRGDLSVAGLAALLVASTALLWMMSRPMSRLSQWLNQQIDQAVCLPGGVW
jgi:hypothetical protein